MIDFIKYVAELCGFKISQTADLLAFLGIIIGVLSLLATLIAYIPSPYNGIKWLFQRYKDYKLAKKLRRFGTYSEIQYHTRYYVPTKIQENLPDSNNQHSTKGKRLAIPYFLKTAFKEKKDKHRFYLVLADSGMGKTTFMINLYQQYISQWWGKEGKIELLSLKDPEIEEKIDAIASEHLQTIILLDAFDEDQKITLDYRIRLKEIMNKVKDFRQVVITCRTQFFVSEKAQPEDTWVLKYAGQGGQYTFKRFYISLFEDKEINLYLHRKFPFLQSQKREKAFKIVNQVTDLMVRPMLLSYIDYLLDGEEQYDFTFQIYEKMIAEWIKQEVDKSSGSRIRNKKEREDYKRQLEIFTKIAALDIYNNQHIRKGLFIPFKELEDLANNYSEINLTEIEIRSRSLLNTDGLGNYKFAHKSILEYLLAKECIEDKKFRIEFDFRGMNFAQKIYQELSFLGLLPILQADNGEFWLEEDKKPRLLTQIKEENIKDVVRLKIKDVSKFKIHKLEIFPKLQDLTLITNEKLLYSLYVVYLFQNLLLKQLELYSKRESINWFYMPSKPEKLDLSELLKWFEWFDQFKLYDLKYLNECFKLLGLHSLRNLLERLDQYDLLKRLNLRAILGRFESHNLQDMYGLLELYERFKQLDIHKLHERIDHSGRSELGEICTLIEWFYKLKGQQNFVKDEKIINNLKTLDEYAKEVQALQKQMPNCHIYY